MNRFKFALAMVLGAVLMSGSAFAKNEASAFGGRGNSVNAKRCQKSGWQTLVTGTGDSFANQDACVAYAARGGQLFRPLLVAVPDEVVENQGLDFTASGFHANANATLEIDNIGGAGGSVTLGAVTDANGGQTFTGVFTTGACGNGLEGAEYTFTDEFGLTASVIVTLDCP